MQHDNQTLQDTLKHIYWIGGSPCSGKSTLAETLAAKYHLSLYQTDTAYPRHAQIVTQEKQPVFYKLAHASNEELWMRPIKQQVAEEIQLYLEEFPLILEELLALPKSQPVLAEGTALLPECVTPLLSRPQQALWIVPTAEFQLSHYTQRSWAKDVVRDCTDPEQAFHNWMQRDIQFATFIKQEALQREQLVLVTDGASPSSEITTLVEQYFQLDALI